MFAAARRRSRARVGRARRQRRFDRGRHAGRGRRARDHGGAGSPGRGAQGRRGQEGGELAARRPGRSSICRRRARRSVPTTRSFVSEHDSSVEHETKKYGRFEDNARQGNQNGTASVPRPGARRPAMGGWRCARPISGSSCAVQGRRDRRRAPGVRAAPTARPNPGHLEQGGAIPELGADVLPAGRRRRARRQRAVADAQRGAAGARDRRRHAGRAAATSTTATRPRSTRSAGGSRRSSTASSGRSRSTGTRTRSTASATRRAPCTGAATATPSCASS